VNRLSECASPYLRSHAAQLVAWQPWGPSAFEIARRLERPIFLSIGYSSCHWCHVMSRESFEDTTVAELLNRHFVCIKVDREEHPEVDARYMRATVWMTGHGGWPNSVWLTPDGHPWFAATYLPAADRPGRPGLRTVLTRLAEIWRLRRTEVEVTGRTVWQAIAEPPSSDARGVPAEEEVRARTRRQLAADFDPEHGGFGGAPKFPPMGELSWLIEDWMRDGHEPSRAMADLTLTAIVRGGVHDRVGGGFHRYATDEEWFLPHFEKLLGENARLLAILADGWRITARPEYAIAAEGIVRWMLGEMRSAEGTFFAALDADDAGGEGRFYQWTWDELVESLDAEDLALARDALGARPEGNTWSEATGRPTGWNLLALCAGDGRPVDGRRLARLFERLREARSRRIGPFRDETVLLSWNGLAVSALAHAGMAFRRSAWVEAASRTALSLAARFRDGSQRWLRARVGPRAGGPARLDDLAYFADGLLDLAEADGDRRWVELAGEVVGAIMSEYRDEVRGGFWDALAPPPGEPDCRGKEPYDTALPNAAAVACRALRRLHAATSAEIYRVMAEEAAASAASRLTAGVRPMMEWARVLAFPPEPDRPMPRTLRAAPCGPMARAECGWIEGWSCAAPAVECRSSSAIGSFDAKPSDHGVVIEFRPIGRRPAPPVWVRVEGEFCGPVGCLGRTAFMVEIQPPPAADPALG